MCCNLQPLLMLESYPNIPGLGAEAVLIAYMSSCVKEISGHIGAGMGL